ncbi:hypothetical protein N136_01345 [Leifsonia aquatica ATCC 14665]|uniref:Uncharacterized protein n=1 Tax=Leifsonia aquatica ATCC 14665 TaxID=1358026 RepID=U2T476_LEIAQ|nr:hypothetical protein N136_01345 [Leifsonia aquatica ATCC 14665]
MGAGQHGEVHGEPFASGGPLGGAASAATLPSASSLLTEM